MNVAMAYLGRSRVRQHQGARILQLEPNLARDPVAFDAPLADPLRFREAISALHDVVVSNLRYEPRDKTAYLEWKAGERQRLAEVRRDELRRAREAIAERRAARPTRDLQRSYSRCLKRYWTARRAYNGFLRRNDPELWRKIMPYDPVITVADDVVFFECFSADESSYGCLTVGREDGFGRAQSPRFGTTNVDYSWDLYNHFQSLRSYRETRFQIDPEGFDVGTEGRPDYREEKIDLPPGWLRGFMQLQGAMGMPMRRVPLSRDAVYSILAWLKRHRAKRSPRAIRFELLPGHAPRLVLEPWDVAIVSRGTRYDGPSGEPLRIWGRRRLLVLARLLPLLERVDVYLLGTGLPTFWVARMGEMRLTLGLSGWTANDWTRGSALDLLAPPAEPSGLDVDTAASYLQDRRAARFEDVVRRLGHNPATAAATLSHLAHAGQVICDLDAGLYRWRQVLPMAVGEAEIGPPNPELVASGEIVRRRRAVIESRDRTASGILVVGGKADGKPAELAMDGDGRIRRGKCVCGHHRRAGLRNGPCRHLLALRQVALGDLGDRPDTAARWYERLRGWAATSET